MVVTIPERFHGTVTLFYHKVYFLSSTNFPGKAGPFRLGFTSPYMLDDSLPVRISFGSNGWVYVDPIPGTRDDPWCEITVAIDEGNEADQAMWQVLFDYLKEKGFLRTPTAPDASAPAPMEATHKRGGYRLTTNERERRMQTAYEYLDMCKADSDLTQSQFVNEHWPWGGTEGSKVKQLQQAVKWLEAQERGKRERT